MASAIISLIGALAPSLINLITGLVHQNAPVVETTNGPGTGPVKFADLFGIVITALQKAAAVGTIGKDLPNDDIIKAIIQAVVTSMQMMGQLGGPGSAPVTTSSIGTYQIVGGSIQLEKKDA